MKITKTETKLLTAVVYAYTYATAKFVGEHSITGLAHYNGKRELAALEKLAAKGLVAIVNREESFRKSKPYGSFVIADNMGIYDIMGGQFYKDMYVSVVKNLPDNHPSNIKYKRELKYQEEKAAKGK